jgi:hypothetical protein
MRHAVQRRLLLGDAYTPLYPEIATVAIEGRRQLTASWFISSFA